MSLKENVESGGRASPGAARPKDSAAASQKAVKGEGAQDASMEGAAPIRLQVYLAHAGLASRRAAEKFIAEGRITVNGVKVSVPGEKILPGDDVRFDGAPVKPEERLLYLVLNKPPQYICSSYDPEGRPLALDLLSDFPVRLYNVGRLDYLSSGLIIFTNDGKFAGELGHPRAGIEKEYLVESKGRIPDEAVDEFARGLVIEGVLYRAKQIEKTGSRTLRVVLVEGKNREIRRVFSHFHLHPTRLRRVRIGPVLIGSLPEGKARPLSGDELAWFRDRSAGTPETRERRQTW